MVKKLVLLFIFSLFSFTNIHAQVPAGYQDITFNDWFQPADESYSSDIDTVYSDLWTFVNFRQSYIEINGTTVVSRGDAIPQATFRLRVDGGQHFELIYDDLIYRFALEEVDYNDLTITAQPYTVYITPTGDRTTVPSMLIMELSLPNADFIPEVTASESFIALITGYGMNNPVGLLIIFMVVLLTFNIALSFIKVPAIVYIVVNLAVGSGFMFFNFIPLWAGFIFIAVMILFLLLFMKGANYE